MESAGTLSARLARPGKSLVTEAVIVSACGRGVSLALELAERGWSVALVDVTESLGLSFGAEETDGPFGWFEAPGLMPSGNPRNVSEREPEMIAARGGLTLALREGPIELGGELTDYLLTARGVPAVVQTYLRALASGQTPRETRAVRALEFRENWLAHFAHHVASPIVGESYRALDEHATWPVTTPLWVRRYSKATVERSFNFCEGKGITVMRGCRVSDVRLNGRHVDALEISNARAGVQQGRAFVWTLSSAETDLAPETVARALFPKGSAAPSWYWSRYRIDYPSLETERQLPAHVLYLDDPFLPWTRANLIAVKSLKSDHGTTRSEAWVKLPARAANDRVYREEIGREIEAHLRRRMPSFAPTLSVTEAALATDIEIIRWPIFERETLTQLRPLKASNFFFCGQEEWPTLDLSGNLRRQAEVLEDLVDLKERWVQAEIKAARQRGTTRIDSSHRDHGPGSSP